MPSVVYEKLQQMAHSDRIKYLLRKYFCNECTSYEKDELLQWMQSPANQNELEIYLQEHWLEIKDDMPANIINYDQVWREIETNIISETKVRSTLMPWQKIAATLLILFTAVAIIYLLANTSIHESSIASYTTEINPKGKQSKIILPDSSIVYLNVDSELVYPQEFAEDQRIVKLSGEAYFDVKSNEKPFIIKLDNAEIKVLGTSFNVNAYPGVDLISTTLVEGEVKLKVSGGLFDKNREAVLKPNQRAHYFREDKKLALEEVNDVSLYTSWKDGKLIFENEEFGQVALKLERWFAKEIELLDDIKEERFTGKFENESLEQILEIVDTSTPIKYSISGNKVLIKLKK